MGNLLAVTEQRKNGPVKISRWAVQNAESGGVGEGRRLGYAPCLCVTAPGATCSGKAMRLAPRHWANMLFLWLSLATVLVPAIGSSGSPLRLTEGSAFSAFTSDVSLGPS